jgi:hypothetical protein
VTFFPWEVGDILSLGGGGHTFIGRWSDILSLLDGVTFFPREVGDILSLEGGVTLFLGGG